MKDYSVTKCLGYIKFININIRSIQQQLCYTGSYKQDRAH